MKPGLTRAPTPTTLLARLIESPDLVRTIQALPGPAFLALVRHIGVEDSAEIVALATTDQLVAAFDEDLFSNARPGERERFDPQRFAVWLEILLEAGEAAEAALATVALGAELEARARIRSRGCAPAGDPDRSVRGAACLSGRPTRLKRPGHPKDKAQKSPFGHSEAPIDFLIFEAHEIQKKSAAGPDRRSFFIPCQHA